MFSNPDKNIASLLLQEGMKVADFGAGNGFTTRAIAKRVGHTGHVYAIEVQKELVLKLESELKEWGIHNVSVIWGDIEKKGGTKIAEHSLDAVVISSVLFQVEEKLGLIDEARRVLKPGGRVLLIEWESGVPGVVTPKKAEELFTLRGFTYVEKVAESSHHYGIIFKYESR
jgi:ubiquinone/menaquinone biosynthesis C-methylase UbiE